MRRSDGDLAKNVKVSIAMTSIVLALAAGCIPALAEGRKGGKPDDAAALAKFHMNLSDLEKRRRVVVTVLQIGDSHTAADHLSGRLRSLLQQRFGHAGRGFMPPGAPHAWYRPYQVGVTQSPGWKTLTSNKTKPDAAVFGLSGVVAQAADPADVITIDLKSETQLQAVEVGLRTGSEGGTLTVLADGAPVSAAEIAKGDSWRRLRFELPSSVRRIEMRPAGDGLVELTDQSLQGNKPGIRLANVGFIGAQISLLSRWHWPTAARQIAELEPSLVILAFGTNEGHAPVGSIVAGYEAEFALRLRQVRAAAPEASIVVIGPPDANRYPKYCLPKPRQKPPEAITAAPSTLPDTGPATGGGSTGTPPGAIQSQLPPPAIVAAPPPEPPADAKCQPLTTAERRDYDRMIDTADRELCRWHTPAAFPIVRRIQRDVAARQGVLFFDWFELFETECGADRWFRDGLAHKDRVHFKQDGYWRAADRLYARLLAGYAAQPRAGKVSPSPEPQR